MEPERLQLNFVLLYPTLRGALENCAALTWLLRPESRQLRLERFIRVMRRDANQFVVNNKRLAMTYDPLLPMPEELFTRLALAMATEGPLVSDYLDTAAKAVGVTIKASRGPVLTATPIVDVYGNDSLPHVVWRFLSDLTHFSFTVMKNQELAEADSGEPVRVSTLLVYTATTATVALGPSNRSSSL